MVSLTMEDLLRTGLIRPKHVPIAITVPNSKGPGPNSAIGVLPGVSSGHSIPSEDKIPSPPSIFMKALAVALKTWLSQSSNLSGDGEAFFICPVQQAGVPGGTIVPNAVTNYQLFAKADAIQRLNHPLYTTAGAGSYFDLLSLYMRYVNMMLKSDDKLNVRNAREAVLAAERQKNKEYERARQLYIQLRKDNPKDIRTFVDYLAADAGYNDAWENEMTLQGQYYSQLDPALEDIANKQSILKSANDRLVPKLGNNMPCDAISIDYINYYYTNQSKLTSDPRDLYYRPSYVLSNYEHICNNWMDSKTRGPPWGPYPLMFKHKPGTWAKLGHPDLDSVPEDDFTELQGKFLSMIKASVTFDGEPQALDVERGFWEVHSLHFPTSDNAPEYIKQPFVKTTRLLMAWGLTIDVTLPAPVEEVSTQDIELSDWGIPLKSTSADGKTLTFKAGSKFHPILVATLGKLVGGH